MNERIGNESSFIPTSEELLKPEAIDRLVEEQRIPHFLSLTKGSGEDSRYVTWCLVPPPGTKIGNHFVAGMESGITGMYFSPEGVKKGPPKVYEYDPEVGAILERRVILACKKSGIYPSFGKRMAYKLNYFIKDLKDFLTGF